MRSHIAGPIDLVGISFGGSLITNFADKYPDRVRSLIYFDPSIRKPYQLSLLEDMPPVWNYLTAMMDERYWAKGQLGDFLHPGTISGLGRSVIATRCNTRVFGARDYQKSSAIPTSIRTDQFKRVGQHPRPVLVIWGKQDNTVPFEESEWLMKVLVHGRLVPIEGSGHLPQWEQPEEAHREMIAFLQTPS